MYYPMTWATSQAPREALKAFAGHRWHTTGELATHAHYGHNHMLRTLRKLAADGIIEASRGPGRGHIVLWRIPETRHCTYCNTPQPLDHFFKNYRNGGWYHGCKQARHDNYIRNKHLQEEAA